MNNPIEKAEAIYKEEKDVQKAAQLAKEALLQNPEEDRAYALIGQILQDMGNHNDAIANFNSAIELNSTNLNYYCGVTLSCLLMNMQKDALEYLEKGLLINPEHARTNYLLGRYYYQYTELRKAIAPLNKAIEINKSYFEAYELLSMIYETLSELDKLEEVIKKARSIDPDNVNILLPSARLHLRNKEFDKAKECLNKIVSDPEVNPKWRRASAYHDLGKISDRQENYDEAFENYSKGQQLLFEVNTSTGANLAMNYYNLVDVYKQWFIEKNTSIWPKERTASGMPNPVFLIGFPRSGTTLTEQIIAAHPNIIATDEAPIIDDLMKSLPALLGQASVSFPQIINKIPEEGYEQLRQAYNFGVAKLFDEDISDKTILDKMPLNIANIGFISRIFPGAKFIMMFRDPRDACLSCFMQNFNHNTAMAEMYSIEGSSKVYQQTMDLYLHYKKVLHPNILEIKYEELLDDLEGHARKLLDFIGEDWDKSVLKYYEKDKQRAVTTPSYEAVTKPIYKSSAGRWKNYEKYFADILPILEPYIKEFGYET
jgi:tetratricopeptide (TPR) repeat protein